MDAALDELSGGEHLMPRGWSENRRVELEAHLAGCPQCRLQWDALRSAEIALRSPKPVAAPESLLVEFRQRLAAEADAPPRRAPAERSRNPWGWLWPVGSLAAAGAAAAAVMLFNVQVSPTPTERQPAPAAAAQRGDRPANSESASATPPATNRLADLHQLATKATPSTSSDTLGRAPGVSDSTLAFKNVDDRLAAQKSSLSTLAEKSKPAGGDASVATDFGFHLRATPTVRPASPPAREKVAANLYRTPNSSQWSIASNGSVAAAGENNSRGLKLSQANTEERYFVNAQQGQVLYGTDAAQTAAFLTSQNTNLTYAQVSLEPLPAELNVSTAILTALQRPVEVELANAPVQAVADQLAYSADVVLRVDPTVALKYVTVREEGTPLWLVLQDVAKQSELEVVPQDNALYLRRIATRVDLDAAAAAPAPPGAAGARSDPNFRYAEKKQETLDRLERKPADLKLAPTGAPVPTGPRTLAKATRGAAPPAPIAPERPVHVAGRGRQQPDRRVWPAAWGNLPERGFETPKVEELPPLVLAPVVPDPGAQPVPQLFGRAKSPPKRVKPVRTRK
jgi:hypothetical protein